MNTTPSKNKAITSRTTKNETIERTLQDARAEAASDIRVSVGLGASGVYGADDAFNVAEATTDPEAPTQDPA